VNAKKERFGHYAGPSVMDVNSDTKGTNLGDKKEESKAENLDEDFKNHKDKRGMIFTR